MNKYDEMIQLVENPSAVGATMPIKNGSMTRMRVGDDVMAACGDCGSD